MKGTTITIKGKEYLMRYSLRSIMAYEQLAGMMSKDFMTRTAEVLLTYYSCIFAYNDDVLPLEEFIEEMDADISLFRAVAAEYEEQSKAFNASVKPDAADGKKKG